MIKATARWDVFIDIKSTKNIEVYIDMVPTKMPNSNTVRFFVIYEELSNYKNVAVAKKDYCSYILTYWQDLLDTEPKARFFDAPTPFVYPVPDLNKRFGVSTIISGRIDGDGRCIRQLLFTRKEEINIPKEFYLSSYTPVEQIHYTNNLILGKEGIEKLIPLSCMFHIAIQNVSIQNHFDEKLIDCLLTKTIPIHWGTPNIEDYFNPDGIIEIKDTDTAVATTKIIEACNLLTPEYYYSRMEAIEDNYNRALEYKNFDRKLEKEIQNIINNEIQQLAIR